MISIILEGKTFPYAFSYWRSEIRLWLFGSSASGTRLYGNEFTLFAVRILERRGILASGGSHSKFVEI